MTCIYAKHPAATPDSLLVNKLKIDSLSDGILMKTSLIMEVYSSTVKNHHELLCFLGLKF